LNKKTYPPLFFALGLILGGTGWLLGDGPWQLASARIADERYEQRPPCRAARVTFHQVLHLRFGAPRTAIAAARSIRIADPLRPEPLLIHIEPGPAGSDQSGFIVYANLFGQAAHRETWRPFCEGWRCSVSINYHPPKRDQSATPRTIIVTLQDDRGQPLFTSTINDVPITMNEVAAVRTDWPMIRLTKERAIIPGDTSHNLEIVKQTNIDGQRKEEKWTLASREQAFILPIATEGADYASLFVSRLALGAQNLVENKIEWQNSQDPFMACPATDNAAATDASPTTPSRQMPMPDGPQKPE
jgi:hypothetical protein